MFERYNDILSAEEVCEMLYVGRNGLYKLLGSGEIKAFRNGKTWRIPRTAVEEYVMRKSGMCRQS